MPLLEKIERIAWDCGVDPRLPMAAIVHEANEMMGLGPIGSLVEQAEALLLTMGVDIPPPRSIPLRKLRPAATQNYVVDSQPTARKKKRAPPRGFRADDDDDADASVPTARGAHDPTNGGLYESAHHDAATILQRHTRSQRPPYEPSAEDGDGGDAAPEEPDDGIPWHMRPEPCKRAATTMAASSVSSSSVSVRSSSRSISGGGGGTRPEPPAATRPSRPAGGGPGGGSSSLSRLAAEREAARDDRFGGRGALGGGLTANPQQERFGNFGTERFSSGKSGGGFGGDRFSHGKGGGVGFGSIERFHHGKGGGGGSGGFGGLSEQYADEKSQLQAQLAAQAYLARADATVGVVKDAPLEGAQLGATMSEAGSAASQAQWAELPAGAEGDRPYDYNDRQREPRGAHSLRRLVRLALTHHPARVRTALRVGQESGHAHAHVRVALAFSPMRIEAAVAPVMRFHRGTKAAPRGGVATGGVGTPARALAPTSVVSAIGVEASHVSAQVHALTATVCIAAVASDRVRLSVYVGDAVEVAPPPPNASPGGAPGELGSLVPYDVMGLTYAKGPDGTRGFRGRGNVGGMPLGSTSRVSEVGSSCEDQGLWRVQAPRA